MNPNAILAGRRRLTRSLPKIEMNDEDAAEGGCGVIGLASEVPIAGRHLFNSLEQMRNRGNGKGGGVAMVGLDPAQFGTTKSVMDGSYLIAVAWVNSGHREAVEEKYIHAAFEVDHIHDVPVIEDWTALSALDVCPPDVTLYWVRPTEDGIAAMFAESGMTPGDFEDLAAIHAEYVFRTFPVLDAFDFKVMSFQVGAMKPDSRIYEAALALADCSPHECFFIDDMIENVEQARLSGMQSEVYSGAQLLIEQLEARGVSLDLVDDPKST